MIKLDNHRLLKPTEIIRKGDFCKNTSTGKIYPVDFSIGKMPQNRPSQFEFYRRKHTKKLAPVNQRQRHPTVKPVTVKKAVAKYPTVTFKYHYLQREVQVIALDDKYLSGLEVTRSTDGTKYQFKKFLRTRIQSAIHLVALADKQ